MYIFIALPLLALSLLSDLVVASPAQNELEFDKRHIRKPKTCTATYITTVEVQTVTITSVATIPHSCYTYLEPTSQSNNAFCGTINLSSCPIVPACLELQTVFLPCFDPCCPTTATVKTPGACLSCQKGCETSTVLSTSSGCPPKPKHYW